jgi:creatinine amidohydrolase
MAIEECDMKVALVSLFDLIDTEIVQTPGDGHAGEIETSMMMAIRNDLVEGLPQKHFPNRPRFLILKDVKRFMGNGIMGNPEPATLEKGKAFLEMAVKGVIAALDEMETFQRQYSTGL